MHVNWGFWGLLLGVATAGEVYNDRMQRGDDLAKTLIMLAGNGEDDEFFRILGYYRFGGTMNQAWVSAHDAANELQRFHDGEISEAPHAQAFREWCRTLV